MCVHRYLFLIAIIFISSPKARAGDLPAVRNGLTISSELPLEPLALNNWSKDSHGWTDGWLTGPTIGSTPLESVPVVNVPGFTSNTADVPLSTTKMAEIAQQSFVNHALNEDNIHAGEVIFKSIFKYQPHLQTDLGPTFRELFRQPRSFMEVKSIFAYLLQATFLNLQASWSSHALIETIDYDLYYLEGLRWDAEHGIRTNRLKAKNQKSHGNFVYGKLMGAIVRYNKTTKEMVFLTSPQVFCFGYEGISEAHYEIKDYESKGQFLMIVQPKTYGDASVDLFGLEDSRIHYQYRRSLKQRVSGKYYYELLNEGATLLLGHTTFWQSRETAEKELDQLIQDQLPNAWLSKCDLMLGSPFQKLQQVFKK